MSKLPSGQNPQRKVRCTSCDSVTARTPSYTVWSELCRYSRIVFARVVNRIETLRQKNKISHEVRLLDCDLMWRRFVLPVCPVKNLAKSKHPSRIHAAHVPACGHSRSPRTSRHQAAARLAARVCQQPGPTCRSSRLTPDPRTIFAGNRTDDCPNQRRARPTPPLP